MPSLPALPPTVRSLNDAESARLHKVNPNLQMSLDDCRTCGGTKQFRWVADPGKPIEHAEVVAYDCDCRAQFRLSRYLLAHNMGAAAARWCWGDVQHVPMSVFEPIAEYATNCKFYADQGVGLYLYSQGFGTGKTLLAALVLKSFLAAGIESYWTTFAQLLDVYKTTFRDNDERDWFDKHIRNAPVLVIDDIGKEPKGLQSMTDPALDTLLRTRVQNGLTTIITSNMSRHEVWERYTSALGSLVNEAMLGYEFPMLDFNVRDWSTKRQLWELQQRLRRPWTLA